MRRWLAIPFVVTAAFAAEPALPPVADRPVDFRRDVLPLLKEHCFDCHSGRQAESGIRLDQRTEILGETNGVPLAVVRRSDQSRLVILAARVDPKRAMPPPDQGQPLTAEQVGVLRAWIDQGLKWDDERLPPDRSGADHWAFRPVKRPAIPAGNEAASPVDAFLDRELRRNGLRPVSEAKRETLVRRLSLVVQGLPPSPDEVETFVRDESPDAYERLVERMFASPRYGERIARHWLDVARWAETEGYESNHPRPYAWRYRDYVVNSLNADKPYDRFLREQIAGDELLPYADENLIATGFLAGARLSSNEEDRALQRNDVLIDIVNAVGSGVLGLSFQCSQCHNHKFDPLTQRDYYGLQAFFATGQANNLVLRDPALWDEFRRRAPPGFDAAVQLRDALYDQARRRAQADVRAKLPEEQRRALDTPPDQRTETQRELARQADLLLTLGQGAIERAIPAEDRPLYDELKKKIAAWEKNGVPDRPQTWGFYSPRSPTEVSVLPMKGFYPLPYVPDELRATRSYILVRGDVHRRGPTVTPRFPAVIAGSQNSPRSRSELVDWLTNGSQPLTARVWVNRLWQQIFGVGLVATSGDFGLQGSPPSHPELLDFLACELMDSGWSTKHVQRLILNSAAFRRAARADDTLAANDPENRWLGRWKPRRLEAEAIRDTVLAVSGELHGAIGGKSVDAESSPRRSLYVFQRRDQMPESQRLFDGPTANESCSRRHVSTVALQPLYLLNSPTMWKLAQEFAGRCERESGPDRDRIDVAFRLALARRPTPAEAAAVRTFLAAESDPQAWARFCQSLLNLNEFVYVE